MLSRILYWYYTHEIHPSKTHHKYKLQAINKAFGKMQTYRDGVSAVEYVSLHVQSACLHGKRTPDICAVHYMQVSMPARVAWWTYRWLAPSVHDLPGVWYDLVDGHALEASPLSSHFLDHINDVRPGKHYYRQVCKHSTDFKRHSLKGLSPLGSEA